MRAMTGHEPRTPTSRADFGRQESPAAPSGDRTGAVVLDGLRGVRAAYCTLMAVVVLGFVWRVAPD
jgi:hypothetical protein